MLRSTARGTGTSPLQSTGRKMGRTVQAPGAIVARRLKREAGHATSYPVQSRWPEEDKLNGRLEVPETEGMLLWESTGRHRQLHRD